MKFGRDFQVSLEKGEYPQEWIDSAIAYRKLKKCIKKVQQELLALGLDRSTMEALWRPLRNDGSVSEAGEASGTNTPPAGPLRYAFPSGRSVDFTPKLTIAIDPRDGSPMDAWLSDETRLHLRRLVEDQQTRRRLSVPTLDASDSDDSIAVPGKQTSVTPPLLSPGDGSTDEVHAQGITDEVETIEVPLTSDLEFFRILRRQLDSLERLQKSEQKQLSSQIVQLGHNLQELKSSNSKKSKQNIEAWREIFRQYTESQIFFSSNEQDAGARDAARAQTQLQEFSHSLVKGNRSNSTSDKLVAAALDRFMQINLDLLRLVKFQEINRIALSKILKKFDKRTALHVQLSKSQWLTDAPFVAQDLARATCYTISEELLQIIPQLDDYLCPICFSVSFKPIRLRCNHVFCIRCLVVMQRANQDHCPLCRDSVVMEATSDDLDEKLMKFLKSNFPQEVKAKQKANEIAAGVDQFGEGFTGTHRCVVM